VAVVLSAVQLIDKRITPRFIRYERADTVAGSVVVVLGAAALIMIADYAVRGTALVGKFTDALGIAHALGDHSALAGSLFAIVLFDASIVGAAAVTLASSYAFGDMFNLRHSLHRSFRDAKGFYVSYTGLVVLAAGIVLIPSAPLGLITTSVQALAGLLLPSASVFLLLLCNDPEVLGPWVNPRWLNILATIIIAVLLMLSGILMATTLFPTINTTQVALWLGAAIVAGLAVAGIWLRVQRGRRGTSATPSPVVSHAERATWRMPPLALLKPVTWSPGVKLGMSALRGYLVISAVLLIVKAVQLSN
jgi:hypothetical protein